MTGKFLRRIDPSRAPLSADTSVVTIGTGMRKLRFAREDAGQTVVLVALMFTVLMGFAALGIDVGRFYSERRFIQDAVDSAALACANKFAQGGVATDAWNAGDAVLQLRNLKNNPLGVAVTYAAQGSEVYDPTVDDHNLISGIKPVSTNGRGCRVAITVDVPTFLIKIVSPSLNTIKMTTMGYAKSRAGFYPSVVQRWANQPGPGNGNVNNFIDHIMAEGRDYNCTTTNTAGCDIAMYDGVTKGREFILFGQAAKATNDSSFRGYIALDIRDFTNTDGSGNLIHEQTSIGIGYNEVPVTSGANTLKDLEANWILEPGYPGPEICAVQVGNFLPCAQIAVINGASSGLFVDDYESRFNVGDKILLQLYDGLVKTVPDFTMASGTLNLPLNGNATSSIVYTFSPQFAASGAVVTTALIPDDGTMTDDAGTSTNPFLTASGPCATLSATPFSANPTLPNQSTYTQIWNTITTNSCDKGIYQAWVRGTSSAPYTSRVHEALVNVNVGGQARDFSLASSDSYDSIASPGLQADYVIRPTTAVSGATKWTGSNLLTLSWAKCPTTTDPSISPPEQLICGIDGNYLTTSVANVDPGENHTMNVQTFLARTGEVYKGWVRMTGLDDVTNKRVTHLLQVTLDVALVSGGATQYADVIGYAVFEITDINSNDVAGRAITGAYLDPNDPALAIGRKIGLVPWEEP